VVDRVYTPDVVQPPNQVDLSAATLALPKRLMYLYKRPYSAIDGLTVYQTAGSRRGFRKPRLAQAL
jgi:hypothetical protein